MTNGSRQITVDQTADGPATPAPKAALYLRVSTGRQAGFTAPDGPPHHLTNPFSEDLIYLMGGESSGYDIAYFPHIGRRLLLTPSGIWIAPDAACEKMTLSQWQAGPKASVVR